MVYIVVGLVVFVGLVIRANILQTPVEGYTE